MDENSKPLLNRGAPARAQARSPRFLYWCIFFLCSLIVAGTSIEATDRIQPTKSAVLSQEWAVGCSIATFILSFLVVVMHMLPIGTIFIVNTRLEGVMIVILTAFMTSLVAIVSSSGNGLAVDQDGSVVFGNLYFSSWIGFIVAFCLVVSYVRSVFFVELTDELSSRSDRMNLWVGNLITCIVLMASAANVYDHWCAGNDKATKYCNRCILAISVGFAGAVLSIIVIGMKVATGRAPWILEFSFAAFMFLTNAFNLGLVTSEIGPGARIGNVFYFSWAALILPFFLMSSAYDEYHARQQRVQEQKDGFLMAQHYQTQNDDEAAFLDPSVQQHMGDGGTGSSIRFDSTAVGQDPSRELGPEQTLEEEATAPMPGAYNNININVNTTTTDAHQQDAYDTAGGARAYDNENFYDEPDAGDYTDGNTYAEGETYADKTYADGTYADGKSYNDGTYDDGTYADGTYADGTYADGTYAGGTYADGAYDDGTYADGTYAGGTFDEGTYADQHTYQEHAAPTESYVPPAQSTSSVIHRGAATTRGASFRSSGQHTPAHEYYDDVSASSGNIRGSMV